MSSGCSLILILWSWWFEEVLPVLPPLCCQASQPRQLPADQKQHLCNPTPIRTCTHSTFKAHCVLVSFFVMHFFISSRFIGSLLHTPLACTYMHKGVCYVILYILAVDEPKICPVFFKIRLRTISLFKRILSFFRSVSTIF